MTFAQDVGAPSGVACAFPGSRIRGSSMPTQLLAQLYPTHLATLQKRAAEALLRSGHDHLLVAAGLPRYQFLDATAYPFAVNPQFKAWLPVTRAPGSWLVITPGQRPTLIYLQPHDYWHVVPAAPSGYWVEHFDIHVIREAKDAAALLPGNLARCAIVGEDDAAVGEVRPNT